MNVKTFLYFFAFILLPSTECASFDGHKVSMLIHTIANIWKDKCKVTEDCVMLMAGLDSDLSRQMGPLLADKNVQALYLDSKALEEQRFQLEKLSWCIVVVSSAANGSSSHALEFVSSPNRQLISFSTISVGKEGTKTEDTELLNPLVTNVQIKPYQGREAQYVLTHHCGKCPTQKIIWGRKADFSLDPSYLECCDGKNPHLKGQLLRVAAYGLTPFLKFDFSKGLFPEVTGVDVDIINFVAKKLGFRIFLTPVRGWDYIDARGVRQGIVGRVYNKRADIGIGHLSLFQERLQLISYSSTPYYTFLTFMTIFPSVRSQFLNMFYPFSTAVWASVLIATVAVGITAWIIHNSYTKIEHLIPFPLIRCRNNSDFILLTWSMLATQPRVPWFESLPKSSGGSILVLLWSLGAFVIVLSYTNTILASLVATDVNAPLDSMDKLAAQIEENEGEVWFVEGTTLLYDMLKSIRPSVRYLANRAQRRGTFFPWTGDVPWSVHDGIVNNGSGAINVERQFCDRLIYPFYKKNGEVRLRMIRRDSLLTGPSGLALPRNSPIVPSINRVVDGLFEGGISTMLFRKDMSSREIALLTEYERTLRVVVAGGAEAGAPVKLTLEQVAASLLILAGMLAAAAAALAAEALGTREGREAAAGFLGRMLCRCRCRRYRLAKEFTTIEKFEAAD